MTAYAADRYALKVRITSLLIILFLSSVSQANETKKLEIEKPFSNYQEFANSEGDFLWGKGNFRTDLLKIGNHSALVTGELKQGEWFIKQIVFDDVLNKSEAIFTDCFLPQSIGSGGQHRFAAIAVSASPSKVKKAWELNEKTKQYTKIDPSKITCEQLRCEPAECARSLETTD